MSQQKSLNAFFSVRKRPGNFLPLYSSLLLSLKRIFLIHGGLKSEFGYNVIIFIAFHYSVDQHAAKKRKMLLDDTISIPQLSESNIDGRGHLDSSTNELSKVSCQKKKFMFSI